MQFVLANAKVVTDIDENDLRLIETCGRISHASGESKSIETADQFVRRIIKMGHESVVEHFNVTVRVECDRAMAQQWMRFPVHLLYIANLLYIRHRLAAYTMESQRYVRYDEIKFVDPEIRDPTDPREHVTQADCDMREDIRPIYSNLLAICHQAQTTYKNLLENGVPPEDARSILPMCTRTVFYTTANVRSWRHFFTERCAPAAQHNIRRVAKELLREFAAKVPACFVDLSEKFLKDH